MWILPEISLWIACEIREVDKSVTSRPKHPHAFVEIRKYCPYVKVYHRVETISKIDTTIVYSR